MGIFLLVFIAIALVILCVFRLKISTLQKILWSVVVIIIVFSSIFYLFIQGFERGRDQLAPAKEDLSQPIK